MKRMLLVFCLGLSACFTAGKRGEATLAVYDLGPPAAPRPPAAALPPLALEIRAPDWLDSLGIRYRLAYAEPGRLREYAQARWAAPPASLMEQGLARRLGLVPAGQGGASCLLRIDLDEISQVFATPAASHGVLQARLAIFDGGRRRLAEQSVNIRQPAPSQDSRGGVAALVAAMEELGSQIGRWQADLAGDGRLKACAK